MGARLYTVSGTYPSMAKNTLLYTFNSEPETVNWDYKNTQDFDEIPFEFIPECWDSYVQTRTVKFTGKFGNDTTTPKSKMENLDKLSFFYTTASYPTGGQAQESNSQGEQVYALEIDMPNNETKLQFVVITDQTYTLGPTHIDYSVSFRECQQLYIM